MFEFHGWAVITIDDLNDQAHDTFTPDELASRLARAEVDLRAAIAAASDDFCTFELRQTCNDLHYLAVHGLRNHRYLPVVALFQWIAEHLPACYGLLYVHDDEDTKRSGQDFSNCFRVWRLARGQLSELTDPFLSPCIPTIERPERMN